jgi:AbrB family looped-hinge helix DNA binding protein
MNFQRGKKMEVAITKMSPNGQVVIPAGIRREAGIGPSAKFIIFNRGGNILLKLINKQKLSNDFDLIEKVALTENQIEKGAFVKANAKMKAEEIDSLLMG